MPSERSLPDVEVDKALALRDDAQYIISDATAREELPALFERLGLWVGIHFREAIKGKKRKVREPTCGILVLGSQKAPLGLYGANNRDGGPEEATNETVNSNSSYPNRHEEGASYSKVNRGDRTAIELFWDALKAWPRALLKSCYGLTAYSLDPGDAGMPPA